MLGHKPIADITAPELLACLRRIESGLNRHNAGKPCTETANRVRSLMSALWRYAIATGRCERDIATDLKGSLTRHVERNFAHITDPQLLGKLLRDVETYRGTPVVRAALCLLPMVFTRPGELRCARWADIDFETAKWRYTVSKTGMPHGVPLAPQAVAILCALQSRTGAGEYVFPGSGGKPISEATTGQALKSLGYGSDVIQPHGFRHTAASASVAVVQARLPTARKVPVAVAQNFRISALFLASLSHELDTAIAGAVFVCAVRRQRLGVAVADGAQPRTGYTVRDQPSLYRVGTRSG